MICNKCGSKIENESTFCPFCGNDLKKGTPTTIPQNNENTIEEVKEEKTSTELENIAQNETVETPPIMMESNTPPTQNNQIINNKTNNDNLKILSIILSILGFFLFPFSIAGIITGSRYKKKEGKNTIGFSLGIISLVFQITIIIVFAVFLIFSPKVTEENSNNQIIGNDYLGYITLSKEWNLYKDTDGTSTLQYQYKNTSSIISIYKIPKPTFSLEEYAKSIKSKLQTYGASDITYEKVKVGKYNAIKQQTYLSSLSEYMTTWCFCDENGDYHYISINSPENNTNHLDIVNTYKLNY